MERYGYIYVTVNDTNGSRYIGQKTSQIFKEDYVGSGKFLWRAIRKIGIEHFKPCLIEWCGSKEKLDERERYWISFYDAVNSREFYNLQAGGQSGNYKGSKLSEETRARMRLARVGRFKGKDNPMYGKSFSQETRKKMSESRKGRFTGEENSMKGKHHSEETRRKISERIAGKIKGRKYCDEVKKVFSECKRGTKNPGYKKVWIVRDTETKRIPEELLEQYLSENWKKGRYVSSETRRKHAEDVSKRRGQDGKFLQRGLY